MPQPDANRVIERTLDFVPVWASARQHSDVEQVPTLVAAGLVRLQEVFEHLSSKCQLDPTKLTDAIGFFGNTKQVVMQTGDERASEPIVTPLPGPESFNLNNLPSLRNIERATVFLQLCEFVADEINNVFPSRGADGRAKMAENATCGLLMVARTTNWDLDRVTGILGLGTDPKQWDRDKQFSVVLAAVRDAQDIWKTCDLWDETLIAPGLRQSPGHAPKQEPGQGFS